MDSFETKEYKPGHPILGVVLGILGILLGFVASLAAGVPAGVVAVVLGLIAVILGIGCVKGGRGIPAIVLGGIAIVLSVYMTLGSIAFMKEMKKEAQKLGNVPHIEKWLENPYVGLIGVLVGVIKDSEHADEIKAEMEVVQNAMSVSTDTATTETPAS